MNSVPLLALLASTAFALGQSKVASDYLSEPEKYEGKKIILPCAYVQRASGPPEDPQNVMFGALTVTKGANYKSGGIRVAVPASGASAFIKKYGLTPDYDQNQNYRTKPLAGIFTKDKVAIITSSMSRPSEASSISQPRGLSDGPARRSRRWCFGCRARQRVRGRARCRQWAGAGERRVEGD